MTLQSEVSLGHNALLLNKRFHSCTSIFSSSSDLTPVEICTSKDNVFHMVFLFCLKEGKRIFLYFNQSNSINGSWLPFCWNAVVILMDFFFVLVSFFCGFVFFFGVKSKMLAQIFL